jgi:hypothetical protein
MRPSILNSIRANVELILSGQYDDIVVKNLYTDARDYTYKNSISREIGDFIAHPEVRDRGLIHERAQRQYIALQTGIDIASGIKQVPSPYTMNVKPSFTQVELANDLSRNLDKIDGSLKKYTKKIIGHADGISCCVLSIVQDIMVQLGDKKVKARISFNNGAAGLSLQYPIIYKTSFIPALAFVIETDVIFGDKMNYSIEELVKVSVNNKKTTIALSNNICLNSR